MGVNDLWNILNPVKKNQSIASLKGKTIAVDLSGWVCQSGNVKGLEEKVPKPYLRNLFFRVCKLLQEGIMLVIVIDGKPPKLKQEEMERRLQARYGTYSAGGDQGRSNFNMCLSECQEMLSYLGVPCVKAEGEAEAMCALLNSQGIVDACLTEDGDTFLYGAHTVYKNLDLKNGSVECYTMTDIKEKLKLDREKLVALALLLGCDYNKKGVKDVGVKKALELMRKLENINILQRFDSWVDGSMSATSSLGAKPSHCKVCHHIGTGKLHKIQGCDMCGKKVPCMQQPGNMECNCSWHKEKHEMDDTASERKIMSKAQSTTGFPFKDVQREFLQVETRERCPSSSSLHWRQPQLEQLQDFNSQQIGWNKEYTFQKTFPLITYRNLTDIAKGAQMQPLVLESFVKTRIKQGVPCIEVRWIRPDWNETDENEASKFFNTTEREELLKSAYPDKYNAFMEEKEMKKSKSSSKRKKMDSHTPGQALSESSVSSESKDHVRRQLFADEDYAKCSSTDDEEVPSKKQKMDGGKVSTGKGKGPSKDKGKAKRAKDDPNQTKMTQFFTLKKN